MTVAIEAEYPALTDPSSLEICELPIRGMTCASCVNRIEQALLAVDGVASADVNLVTHRGTVRFDAAKADRAQLVAAVTSAGYEVPTLDRGDVSGTVRGADALEAEEDAEAAGLRRDFVRAALLGIPVMVLGMSHGAIPGADAPGGRAAAFALTTALVLGPGARFFRAAFAALRHGTSDMNTLVSLGVASAYGWSAVAVLVPGLFQHAEHGVAPHVYFEAAAGILVFVIGGKWLEARARRRLSAAVRGLRALVPDTARRVRDHGEDEVVPLDALRVGDVVRIVPGSRVPVDGEVLGGSSTVNESMLTGESVPLDKGPGDSVHEGTENGVGSLTVRVLRTGAATTLARIAAAVERAQGSRAPIARLADRVSAVFVPTVIGIATVTFVGWLIHDPTVAGLGVAVERFVSVLVIACPCALGLATPAAIAVGTGRGAELGVLVAGGAALEAASQVDSALFDKTGTLTVGRPELTEVRTVQPGHEERVIALAAALERMSEHPLARAVVEGAIARGVQQLVADEFEALPGRGIRGRIEGMDVVLGTSEHLAEMGIDASPLADEAESLAARGQTPVFVAAGRELIGLLALADRPREEARRVVESLRGLGIDIAMVSGDRRATAESVARELGIDRVFGDVKPEAKAAIVASERARGRIVAMIGDGINDAPALATADVGIAVSGGAEVATSTADLTLMRGGIGALPTALSLSRQTFATIRSNLFWAFAYNVVGIPLAAGVLVPLTGWTLSPFFASAAMSLSSVSVLLNSLRLRRFASLEV